jgi:hypothetical protein
MDLAKASEQVEEIARFLEGGQEHVTLTGKMVFARLVAPFRELMKRLNNPSTGCCLLLGECMAQTGLSRSWFDKPQVELGGRTRLEKWREEGLARQAANGQWLIHSAVLPGPGADTPRRRAPADRSGRSEVDNIINSLLK